MSPDKSNIKSVLYVDDEETLLDIGKRFLERDGGYQVTIQNLICRYCKQTNSQFVLPNRD